MQFVQGKELTDFMESLNNKMKTNIKMRVTPEQSKKVQEIYLKNVPTWEKKQYKYEDFIFLYLYDTMIIYSNDKKYFKIDAAKEIDADLFIRTNGICEEDKYTMIDTIIHKPYNVAILEQKLQKKNEILKKARIKRKNQREELHKLNLKLQKCISLEEHNKIVEKINKDNVNYLSNNILSRDKEIEKLKAVIEYLESKVK